MKYEFELINTERYEGATFYFEGLDLIEAQKAADAFLIKAKRKNPALTGEFKHTGVTA